MAAALASRRSGYYGEDDVKKMERTYICRRTGVREKVIFAVADNARPRGKRVKGRTSARKEEANFAQALRRAARILNCNFDHTNGLLITLDFDDEAMAGLVEQAQCAGACGREAEGTDAQGCGVEPRGRAARTSNARPYRGKEGSGACATRSQSLGSHVPLRDAETRGAGACGHAPLRDAEMRGSGACGREAEGTGAPGCGVEPRGRAARTSNARPYRGKEGSGVCATRSQSLGSHAPLRDAETKGSGACGQRTLRTKGAGRLFERDAERHPAIEAEAGVDYQKIRDLAEHQCKLWLRRIARKAGGKLKYLGVSSDMDGQTGELVRAHCHVVLDAPGVSWDALREAWHLGWIDIRQLRKQRDYTPVAVYLMRQVQRVPDKKKYFVSRGMEQPEVLERIVPYEGEIRVQPGATVLERSAYDPDNVSQYVRYLPRKPRPKLGGHQRGDTGQEPGAYGEPEV